MNPQVQDMSQYPERWQIGLGYPNFIFLIAAAIPPKGGQGTRACVAIQSKDQTSNLTLEQMRELVIGATRAISFAEKTEVAANYHPDFYRFGRRVFDRRTRQITQAGNYNPTDRTVMTSDGPAPLWELVPVVEVTDA